MHIRLHAALVTTLLLVFPVTEAASQRAVVIEARNLAYDANYRNDQAGLRSAIAALQTLATSKDEGTYAHYYLSWAYWALAASQVQQKDLPSALESAHRAVEHARAAVAASDNDPEFYTALANALIVVAVLDPSQFHTVAKELRIVRRKALGLGPYNPRTVLMDAGMLFHNPPEVGGGKDKGLARWKEALTLFESEANERVADPIAPRWGPALAYGWMAELYLQMDPPQLENARRAAEIALRMRPDFWYVRDQILPRLRSEGSMK